MNALVVGLSYRTTPVSLLERAVAPPAEIPDLLTRVLASKHVDEAIVLSTCNRIEVYAAATAFHGALGDIADVLAARAGVERGALADHVHVHYDADAARHVFRVAAGLDSMVIGEPHILGQLRDAYTMATKHGAPGRLLHELLQQALCTGKRVRAETGIDRAGQSVLTAALQVGSAWHGVNLIGRPALVVGAGAMGSLALASLRRAGAGELHLANRSAERAERLAGGYGAAPLGFDQLGDVLQRVDVVISATASPGHVLGRELIAEAVQRRGPDQPLLLLDLALPRDVDPAVAELPGVTLIGIEQLADSIDDVTAADIHAAEAIVAQELTDHVAALRSGDVAPTVAALRARADDLVAGELGRLRHRRPELTSEQRADIARTMHRVVQQLLHHPSVRVRELANEPGGARYADALRELFGLQLHNATAAEALEASEALVDWAAA